MHALRTAMRMGSYSNAMHVASAAEAWWSYYPALTVADKETIPFHASMTAPTAPTITTTSNVTSAAEFNTAAAIAGRELTVTTSFAGDVSITASDVRVLFSAGVTITGSITIGTTATIARVEINGGSDKSFADRPLITKDAAGGAVIQSGGTRLYSDIVIRWLKVRNQSASGNSSAFTCKWKNSALIGNCCRCSGYGVFTSHQPTNSPLANLMILGNSMLAEHGTTSGVAMRLGNGDGPIDDVQTVVLHGNHFSSTGATFQSLRLNSIQNFYAFHNVLRGAGTAGAVHFGNLAGDILGNVYVNNNQFYDCSSSSLQYGAGTGPDVLEFKNNTVYGGFTEANWNTATASPDPGDTIDDTGTTWTTSTTHPAWPSAGDPTSL
jgi:hypothetical protein